MVIHSDGASRGNPGLAAIGATIKDEHGNLIACISERIGIATNNEAEYMAIIAAVEKATGIGANRIELSSDSELVVKQIRGEYRVKSPTLKPLYQQVKQLQSYLDSFTINHITRKQNVEAHNLANKALALVANLPPAESYRLIIKFNQTGNEHRDIAFLHKLITILRDFPGQDEVKLSVTSGEKMVSLRLSNIYINYCPKIRKRLVQLVGKRGLRIEPVDLHDG